MAGHSKWNNIKRRKGAQDAKKGKIFTKMGREIQVAVKEGGANPDQNKRLADAIEKAKSYNMPNDSIKRSIKRASDSNNTEDFEAITYEGYGPNGVAVIVNALTDNRNRTAGNIRHIFSKHNGNLGQNGSVSFLFEEKGEIYIETENLDDEEVMMLALEAGAEDIKKIDEAYLVVTSPESYADVKSTLADSDLEIVESSVGPVAMNTVELDEADAEIMQKLIDDLEDDDDVQEVYHNWEQDDEEDSE